MNEFERAQELIPWLVTDRLSSADESFVRKVMSSNTALQKEYKEQKVLSSMVKSDPSVMDIAVITTQEQRLHDLMGRIQADQRNNTPHVSLLHKGFAYIKKSVRALFVPSSNGWVFTAIASVVMVQLVILVLVLDGQEKDSMGATYISASKDDVMPVKRSIVLQFSKDATEADINQLLKKIGGKVDGNISDGPNYHISFAGTMTENDIDNLLFKLENDKKLIDFVGKGGEVE